jgi:hypothetical protein
VIKTIALGFWICLVTLVATWAGATFLGASKSDAAAPATEKFFGGLAEVKPRPVSVPMIVDGAIQGYVMAQMAYTAKKETLDRLSVKPDVFIVDEAFKAIYEGEAVNFKHLKKQDVDAMALRIKENVNRRFGSAFVEDVLFEDINYIPMERVRGGGAKKE